MPPPDPRQPLSAILQEIVDSPAERISVAELMALFGGRALGALLLVFSIACILPLPPGSSTVLGLPLVLLAPQLVVGKRTPWLPGSVRRRTVAVASLRAGFPRVIRWVRRVEAVSRPRLGFLFGPVGERLIGLVCTILAIVLIFPIPGGNFLPAAAAALLSLALILRDGALALVGHGLAIASVGVLVLVFHLVVELLQHSLGVVTGA